MVGRLLALKPRKGCGLVLLLIVPVWMCAAPLPMAALAMPMAAQDLYREAPDPPVSSATALLTPEPELSLGGTQDVLASPTVSPSVTSRPAPAHTPHVVVSAEPTDPASTTDSQQPTPTGTPTPVSPTEQPSPVATVQSVSTATVSAELASAVVVAQALHLREGPGARYPIRAIYGRRTKVRVLGRDRTGHWLRVVTPDERAGWMAVGAVELRASLSDLLVVDGTLPLDGASSGGNLPSDEGEDVSGSRSRAPGDSGIAASAADVPGIMDAPKGLAVVAVEQTILHIAPGTRSEGIQALRQDEEVKLLGQARGAWVRVQAFTAVVPGWVYAADLRPLPGAIAGAPAITTTTISTTATVSSTVGHDPVVPAPSPTLTPMPDLAVVEAVPDPDVVEAAVPPPSRVPVEITVEVVEAMAAHPSRRGPTPTPAMPTRIAGMRVEIVTVFGDVLVEAVTPANGRVTFTRDVLADSALFVQIPALGLRMQLPPEHVASGHAQLTIAVPDNVAAP